MKGIARMSKHVFITGTDTDVGKTVISTAILDYANVRGLTTIGFKPIAAGCEQTTMGLRNADALLLQQHASCKLAYDRVNPIAYADPIAPHIAAQLQGSNIDLGKVDSTFKMLQSEEADLVVIEGAGGWHLPITSQRYFSAWVADNKLDVILVVGIKLGCLNHAILTALAIQSSGANLVGWVANSLSADILHYDAMVSTLKEALQAPLLGQMPYFTSMKDKNSGLADYLDLSSFLDL
jgi:dethiobiotin synthetase